MIEDLLKEHFETQTKLYNEKLINLIWRIQHDSNFYDQDITPWALIATKLVVNPYFKDRKAKKIWSKDHQGIDCYDESGDKVDKFCPVQMLEFLNHEVVDQLTRVEIIKMAKNTKAKDTLSKMPLNELINHINGPVLECLYAFCEYHFDQRAISEYRALESGIRKVGTWFRGGNDE